MSLPLQNGTELVSYRCRKCGQDLCIGKAALIKIEGCDLSSEANILYLNFDFCPKWITDIVEDPCNKMCHCKQHLLPPLQLVKNRIDIIIKRKPPSPVEYNSDPTRFRRQCDPKTEIPETHQGCTCFKQEKSSSNEELATPAEANNPCVLPDSSTSNSCMDDDDVSKCTVFKKRSQIDNRLCSQVTQIENGLEARTDNSHLDVNLNEYNISESKTRIFSRKRNQILSIGNTCSSNYKPILDIADKSLHASNSQSADIADSKSDLSMPYSKKEVCDMQIKKFVRKREIRRRKRDERLDGDNDGIEMSNSFSAFEEFTDEEESIETENPFSALQRLSDINDKTLVHPFRRRERRSSSNEMRRMEAVALEKERDEVPYEWTCCICMELYHHPHLCEPCKHVYCDPCLRLLAKNVNSMRPTTCPLCREFIKDCKPDKDMWIQIKEKFPYSITERTQRVRAMGLKSAPLPKLRNPPPTTAYTGIQQARWIRVIIDLVTTAWNKL